MNNISISQAEIQALYAEAIRQQKDELAKTLNNLSESEYKNVFISLVAGYDHVNQKGAVSLLWKYDRLTTQQFSAMIRMLNFDKQQSDMHINHFANKSRQGRRYHTFPSLFIIEDHCDAEVKYPGKRQLIIYPLAFTIEMEWNGLFRDLYAQPGTVPHVMPRVSIV